MKFSKTDFLFLFITTILLSAAAWHGVFGDEQENITAGWLILKGFVPYRDFFFHHAPLLFFLAGLSEGLSGGRGLLVARGLVLLAHIFTWGFILRFSDSQLEVGGYTIFPKQAWWFRSILPPHSFL